MPISLQNSVVDDGQPRQPDINTDGCPSRVHVCTGNEDEDRDGDVDDFLAIEEDSDFGANEFYIGTDTEDLTEVRARGVKFMFCNMHAISDT